MKDVGIKNYNFECLFLYRISLYKRFKYETRQEDRARDHPDMPDDIRCRRFCQETRQLLHAGRSDKWLQPLWRLFHFIGKTAYGALLN